MAVPRFAPPKDERSFWESPKWVRARSNGDVVVDTRRAILVWEPERPVPVYAVPREDVAPAALEGVREYGDPELEGYVSFRRDAGLTWLDEDEEVPGHPRDPFHRIDVHESSRHVRISIGGDVVAESSRPVLLFETGLPMRAYFDPEDVRMDLLTATETRTFCPYKGYASYWTARAGETDHVDVAWTYVDPVPDMTAIAGRIAFFDEKVDVDVDGERSVCPVTPWS